METEPLLREVGERIRAQREALGLTQKELAARSGLSLRFLAQVERGGGNISVLRLAQVAAALGVTAADLLGGSGVPAGGHAPRPVLSLLGLRGAGKSSVGRRLADRYGVPFVELDQRIEHAAGLSLSEIFELHGEAYYRRLEREALRQFLAEVSRARLEPSVEPGAPAAILATGGSIVNDRETFRILKENTVTIWLKARPEDHWNRVLQQGDQRPMAQNPHAFTELCALLQAREPLYSTAHKIIDTSAVPLDGVVHRIGQTTSRAA